MEPTIGAERPWSLRRRRARREPPTPAPTPDARRLLSLLERHPGREIPAREISWILGFKKGQKTRAVLSLSFCGVPVFEGDRGSLGILSVRERPCLPPELDATAAPARSAEADGSGACPGPASAPGATRG